MVERMTLPISSKYRSNPDQPVSDSDRDGLTKRLNDEFTSGRMDADTYHRMLDLTYSARNLGQLEPVAAALPVASTHSEPPAVRQSSGVAPGQVNQPAPIRNHYPKAWLAVGVPVLVVVVILIILLAL